MTPDPPTQAERPARVAIPEALAADVAARPEAYRPEVEPGDEVFSLGLGGVFRVRSFDPDVGVGIEAGYIGTTTLTLGWLPVGSVDGGSRPDVGDRVLVLDLPGIRVTAPWVAVVSDPSGLGVLCEAADRPWNATRWALLPPPVADEAAPAPQDAPGTSEPAETVSPNPLRNLRASLVRAARAHGRRARVAEKALPEDRDAELPAWLWDAYSEATMAAMFAETLAAVLGWVGERWWAGDEFAAYVEGLLENGPDGENADVEPDDEHIATAFVPLKQDIAEDGTRVIREVRIIEIGPHPHGIGTLETLPPRPWRVGLSWGRTIIESGTGTPDEQGRRPDDRLVGVVETRADAERVVAAVNATNAYDAPYRALAKSRAETKHLLGILTEVRAWLKAERDRYWAADSGTRDDFRSSVGDAFDRALDYLDERGAP